MHNTSLSSSSPFQGDQYHPRDSRREAEQSRYPELHYVEAPLAQPPVEDVAQYAFHDGCSRIH